MGYDENRSKPRVRNTSDVSLNVSLGAIDLGLGVFFYLFAFNYITDLQEEQDPKMFKRTKLPLTRQWTSDVSHKLLGEIIVDMWHMRSELSTSQTSMVAFSHWDNQFPHKKYFCNFLLEFAPHPTSPANPVITSASGHIARPTFPGFPKRVLALFVS